MTSTFNYNAPIEYDSDQPYDIYVPVPLPAPMSPPATHLAIPLVLNNVGTFNVNLQDSIQEVQQSVEVIIGSVQGQRTVVPSFGMPVPDFQTPSKGAYLSAISEWEKRAVATIEVTPTDSGAAHVRVNVALARGSST